MVSAEIPHHHEGRERLQNNQETIGLQGRLVLADQQYLNPNKEIPSEQEVRIAPLKERSYAVYDRASTRERKSFWNEYAPGVDKEKKYKMWAGRLVTTINKRPQEKLQEYFKYIGIDISKTDGEFTYDHAKTLFDRYFDPERTTNKGVKRFVVDVLSAHVKDNKLDANTFEQNLSEITWLAKIFGEKSAEMVEQLTIAEAQLLIDQRSFHTKLTTQSTTSSREETMRINNLREKEKRVLSHIAEEMITQDQIIEEARKAKAEQKPPEKKPLPILKYKEEIQKQILENDSIIILGGTGSGKTSVTPSFIRQLLKPGEKLYITEPRQVNTEELAGTVAKNEGVILGQEVGFQHGGNKSFDKEGKQTDTLFMTERILVNRLLRGDRSLDQLAYVMVDEVHVQNADTEILLGLLKKEQERRKNANPPLTPLKIIAVSATADKEKLQRYFNTNKAVEVEKGEWHKVNVEFSKDPISSEEIPSAAADKAQKILQSPLSSKGDIVITVAGTKEMQAVHDELTKKDLPANTQIIHLHRESSKKEKEEVGKVAASGERRIIIATNVIDTGVTINGLKYVINSGEKYEKSIEPATGLEYMAKVPQSKAECTQWEGRVGRTSNGFVYHMFTKDDYDKRPAYPKAEILRTDFTNKVLFLKNKGRDIKDLDLLSAITKKEKEDFDRRADFFEETLRRLEALTARGEITDIGTEMVSMTETYRLDDYHAARMLTEAKKNSAGFLDTYTILLLMNEKSLFMNQAAREEFATDSSDFLTYFTLWSDFTNTDMHERENWAQTHGLNYNKLKRIARRREEIAKKISEDSPASRENINTYIFKGYKDRLMELKDANERSYIWKRDKAETFKLRMDRNSVTNKDPLPQFIIAATNGVVTEDQKYVTVSHCHPVDLAA